MPDFLERSIQHQNALSKDTVSSILDAGYKWNLAPILKQSGTIVFPHATLTVCGHQIAAAVHACLDSGADTVLALGVLHALTPELQAARQRVAEGGDPADEECWGVQGPDLEGREDWRKEFSLSHFQFLWRREIERRNLKREPRLIMRFPHLAGGCPDRMPGYGKLQRCASNAVIVATMDAFHHGIGYGDAPDAALMPEFGGLDLARKEIAGGMELLRRKQFAEYNQHCINTRSDGRDVGQALGSLLNLQHTEILDLVADDMTGPYESPQPTWVAGALISLSQ